MLHLPKKLYQEISMDAKTHFPNEVCGILSGKGLVITSLYILPNQASSPIRFYVDENTVADILQRIAKKDEQPIAIYHSHPHSLPVPSKADIKHHPDKDVKMIILSLKQIPYVISCFTITDNDYRHYPIKIERR